MKNNAFRCILLVLTALVFSCGPGEGNNEYFALAEECLASGKIADAAHYYEIYLEHEDDPEQRYTAWQRILFIHLDMAGDTERGLNILRTMSMEFDRDPERMWSIYSRISDLYLGKNNFENSLETIKRAMETISDPEILFKAHLKIADIYYSRRDYQACTEALIKAMEMEDIEQDPAWAEAQLMLGKVYLQQENYSQALNYLRQAYDSEASSSLRSRAGLLLYEAYTAVDELEKAGKLLQELKNIHPNPMVIEVMIKDLDENSSDG